jgi:hypothetical protein
MSKFKEYYSDPEFKSRYLAYKNEHIECSGCGKIITRNNYNSHLKSKFHNNNSIKNLKILKLEKNRVNIAKKYDKQIRELKKCKSMEINNIGYGV